MFFSTIICIDLLSFGLISVNLSPVQFARHIGKNSTVDSWKNHLWVMDKDGNRIKLADTDILRFHVQTFDRPLRPFVHRDEFICCTRCNKQRRFLLRTREQCRVYHRASLKTEWICADNGYIYIYSFHYLISSLIPYLKL